MNENGGRSTNILLTVIGIATLLVVVTGATFAYFAAQVSGNDNNTSVYIKAATDGLTVTQIGGQELKLEGIYPREEAWGHQTFGFTVEADSSTANQDVTFYMTVTNNDFDSSDSVVFTFMNRTTALGESGDDAKKSMTEYTETEGTKVKTTVPTAGTTGQVVAKGTRPHNVAGDIIYDLYVYYPERSFNQNTGEARTVSLKITGELTN